MEFVRGMDHGDLPTGRVTNYVASKPSIGYIIESASRRLSRRMSTSIRLLGLRCSTRTEGAYRSLDLFQTYDGLSLTDTTIVAYMQREGD
jgi:predicted nucleic acid-binding protein